MPSRWRARLALRVLRWRWRRHPLALAFARLDRAEALLAELDGDKEAA